MGLWSDSKPIFCKGLDVGHCSSALLPPAVFEVPEELRDHFILTPPVVPSKHQPSLDLFSDFGEVYVKH